MRGEARGQGRLEMREVGRGEGAGGELCARALKGVLDRGGVGFLVGFEGGDGGGAGGGRAQVDALVWGEPGGGVDVEDEV